MPLKVLLASALFLMVSPLSAQMAGVAPAKTPMQQQPATEAGVPKKRQAPHPLAELVPGGGPDKVWVNLTSAKYHCYGDRYYGRTSSGRYMTQAAAKSAGAKGPRGKDCPVVKQ